MSEYIASMDIILSFLATLATIFILPIVVYGLFTAFLGLKEPEKKLSFFIGVLLQKIGTAAAFVTLFYLGRETFDDIWLTYSLIWFAMYAATEIGQVYMPNYSWKEAVAGILSEAIYFPLAGFFVASILK